MLNAKLERHMAGSHALLHEVSILYIYILMICPLKSNLDSATSQWVMATFVVSLACSSNLTSPSLLFLVKHAHNIN